LEEKIQILQNQVDSLQEKVIELETNLENQILVKKENLNVLSDAPRSQFFGGQRIEEGDSSLKVQKDDSRLGNQSKVKEEIIRSKGKESNILSEASKITINDSFQSPQ